MNILKIVNESPVEYSVSRLHQDNYNISFPSILNDDVLSEFNCHTYTVDETPTFNPVLEDLKSFFEQRGNNWFLAFEAVPYSTDVAIPRLQDSITSDRWAMEHNGVEWLDSNYQLWRIDTDSNSQLKITSAACMLVVNPSSKGYSNWKMDKKVGEDWVRVFRNNTLDEWNEIVDTVSSYIEKCFTAEANALEKAANGDLSVTFLSEFEKL